jgi:hypothetical protein
MAGDFSNFSFLQGQFNNKTRGGIVRFNTDLKSFKAILLQSK